MLLSGRLIAEFFSPNGKGVNKLLRMGATPITSPEELLEALGFEQEQDKERQAKLFIELLPEEKKVVALLREASPRDELIRAMKMPTPTANALLSVMEIKGLIKEEMGEIRLI